MVALRAPGALAVIVIGLGLTAATAAIAAEIDGIYFPNTLRVTPEGPTLVLNGAGLRRILFFRIYAIGLYLPAKRSSTQEVLLLGGPKRVLLVMQRDHLTAAQFIDHLEGRINDGRQPGTMAVVKTHIDELYRIIAAEGSIDRGGTIILDYVPGTGTVIRVNGTIKGKPIPGEDFYNALLQIWIGEGAPNTALRRAMLGQ